jgi:NADH:ubiquinone oxidoreductase subunit D
MGCSIVDARCAARNLADGETVIDLDCDVGYLHRMEKIAESMYT